MLSPIERQISKLVEEDYAQNGDILPVYAGDWIHTAVQNRNAKGIEAETQRHAKAVKHLLEIADNDEEAAQQLRLATRIRAAYRQVFNEPLVE